MGVYTRDSVKKAIRAITTGRSSRGVMILAASIGVLVLFIGKIGTWPAGFFCDEALIGLVAWRFSHGIYGDFLNPFFYTHFRYALGVLPVLSTAPFVFLFGLSEWSVRIASAWWSLASLGVIALTLRRIRLPVLVPVLLLATTPIFLHISRINFGITISFFMIALGWYAYIRSRMDGSLGWGSIGGICFGVAAYGHQSFLPGAPLLVTVIIVSEYLTRIRHKNAWIPTVFVLSFIITYLPIVGYMWFHPEVLNRLNDKLAGESFVSLSHLLRILRAYPDYFSVGYVFRGEYAGTLDEPITRHVIPGSGIFLPIIAPFLILGIGMSLKNRTIRPYLVPLILYAGLVPFLDAVTHGSGAAPYSFTLFQGLISVPFIAAAGVQGWNALLRHVPTIMSRHARWILIVVWIGGVLVLVRNYHDYSYKTADYWGWQYGPKQIVDYFRAHERQYDEFYMTGSFNQPEALLEFYTVNAPCPNCRVGGLDKLDTSKRQIFALRKIEYALSGVPGMTIRDRIAFPNGVDEYYLVTVNTPSD